MPDRVSILRYWASRRQQFVIQPDNFFSDIVHPRAIAGPTNYYYCVAYAGDKWYINWFPRSLSPFCPGKFCGMANLSNAELIQIVTNIAIKYPKKTYAIDRNEARRRLNSLNKNSVEYLTFNQLDIDTIDTTIKRCISQPCAANTPDEATAYLKYCTFHLSQCDMQSYMWLNQYPIAEINFLRNEDILTQDLELFKPAPWALIIQMLSWLNANIQCTFNDDYDKDGTTNARDNAPYVSNPDQIDTDGDGIWDVWDPDIDNDGVLNPLGIINRSSPVLPSKDLPWAQILPSKDLSWAQIDNCIRDKNPDQKSTQLIWVGDVCLPKPGWLSISWVPLLWYEPLVVQFDSVLTWAIEPLIRDFGDGGRWAWLKPVYTYKKSWKYIVTASTSRLKASMMVSVLVESMTTLQISPSTTRTVANQPITFVPIATGQCPELRRSTDAVDVITTVVPYVYTYMIPARYTMTAQCLYNNKITALAQAVVDVRDQKTMSLSVDKDMVYINQPINFSTRISWFTPRDICDVQRDMKDATLNNKRLQLQYIYKTPWQKLIHQTITLCDDTKFENYITVYILSPSDKVSVMLKPTPLIQVLWKKIDFELIPQWFGVRETQSISCSMWDQQIRWWFAWFTFGHVYSRAGTYTVTCTITLIDLGVLQSQATVSVINAGNWSCQQYRCDMDKDTTPDLCDPDMDGDGTDNLMGILNQENPNCSITPDIINQPIKDSEHAQAKAGEKIDNCPFDVNKDQKDDNKNGYGNICEKTVSIVCDGVNIPLSECPTTPKDLPQITTITPINCDVCPCQTVQNPPWWWDGWGGWARWWSQNDLVRALLRSVDWGIIQAVSNPANYP